MRIPKAQANRAKAEARCRTHCDCCGKLSLTGLHPHHIYSEGSGGPDASWNLASVLWDCHTRIHAVGGKAAQDALLLVSARRHNCFPEEIRKAVWFFRNCPPRLSESQLAARIAELAPAVARLVKQALEG